MSEYHATIKRNFLAVIWQTSRGHLMMPPHLFYAALAALEVDVLEASIVIYGHHVR